MCTILIKQRKTLCISKPAYPIDSLFTVLSSAIETRSQTPLTFLKKMRNDSPFLNPFVSITKCIASFKLFDIIYR